MANRMVSTLDTVGRMEAHLQEIACLERHLDTLPLWRPAAILSRQAREARRMIQSMQKRLDSPLVVTLVGPSGAGKSTLFNALAGADHLSAMGTQRPTTRDLIVAADDQAVARALLGTSDRDVVRFHSQSGNGRLEHLILVDTPDTDSTRSPAHEHLLRKVVERSDVLICVFDAQNPKRRDHADFMAPLVRRFNGASLVAVVNKCDRHSSDELTDTIGPDFDSYLRKAWPVNPEALLLVCARRHLEDPQWAPRAEPRHELDQFDQLQSLVHANLNRPGTGSDHRVANAGQIKDYLQNQVSEAAAVHHDALAGAAEKINAMERGALQSALDCLEADDRRQLLGVRVRLYQALAQRWLGPVGWLVAIWSRLIVFGSGLAALMRFGSPLRQIWGAVSSWKRFKESRSALEMLTDPGRINAALDGFNKTLLMQWPDLAKGLIRAGFDPAIQDPQVLAKDNAAVSRTLDTLWSGALDTQINRYARGLSHAILQLLFNLPGVALMGYVAWLTAMGFFRGHYLSSDFFLHAVLTMVLVLLLSFFLLQAIVHFTIGKNRIQRHAFEAMKTTVAGHPLVATRNIAGQVAQVMALAYQQKAEEKSST